MGGANGSRECAPDDELRDTHRFNPRAKYADGFRKRSTRPTVLPADDVARAHARSVEGSASGKVIDARNAAG
jgi:hypothetical protein